MDKIKILPMPVIEVVQDSMEAIMTMHNLHIRVGLSSPLSLPQ
jgi:hypothetical protein